MQLRQRLQSTSESLLHFAEAAEQRYWEGVELGKARLNSTGIYLFGYSAEMYLKIAALRFDGAGLGDAVHPYLLPIRRWMQLQHPSVQPEGFHSLIFWMQYLQARRALSGNSLDRNLDGRLEHHVRRIYSTWWVDMRYRPDSALVTDVNRVFGDVSWLRENHQTLWR